MGRITEFLLDKPLATRDLKNEKVTNSEGFATFCVDAVSSTAYATEEILQALVGGALLFLSVSLPIAILISMLIIVVAVSYRQVIHAYPQGGGVYNVAQANLNESFALIGAASLMIDYILTSAVSIAAGIAALTSAYQPLYEHRVILGIVVLTILTFINLRGVRESGKIFIYPTCGFIAIYAGMFIYGGIRMAWGTFPVMPLPPPSDFTGILGISLLLRAFSSGCTAMTGIEAVSNGVQAFKSPESVNASKTLMRMVVILAVIFLGITFLAYYGNFRPKETETIISQIARALFSGNLSYVYYVVQGITLVILTLAANTPFAGFPRVASQLAVDGYLPHQFKNLGSKGVYHFGIGFLAVSASLLLIMFQGTTHALLPLYAVGVFLGFSISQMGMIRYWKRQQGNHTKNILINAVGFIATTLVLVITFYSKFSHGAWMLLFVLPFFVYVMKRINAHYADMKYKLRINGMTPSVHTDKTMVLLVSDINQATLYSLAVVQSHKPKRIIPFHVGLKEEEIAAAQQEWEDLKKRSLIPADLAMEVVFDPYRNITRTIVNYLKEIQKTWKDDSVVAVITEIIPPKWWQWLLHNQSAPILRAACASDPDIDVEILDVDFKVRD